MFKSRRMTRRLTESNSTAANSHALVAVDKYFSPLLFAVVRQDEIIWTDACAMFCLIVAVLQIRLGHDNRQRHSFTTSGNGLITDGQ